MVMKRVILPGLLMVAGLMAMGQTAFAERVGPQGVDAATVSPYGSYTYANEWFYGNAPAAVAVVGDGSTMLQVVVYDESGNLIASDTGFSPTVSWNPLWTGRFVIKVYNLGGYYNTFGIASN
jgi:hypothetical protein